MHAGVLRTMLYSCMAPSISTRLSPSTLSAVKLLCCPKTVAAAVRVTGLLHAATISFMPVWMNVVDHAARTSPHDRRRILTEIALRHEQGVGVYELRRRRTPLICSLRGLMTPRTAGGGDNSAALRVPPQSRTHPPLLRNISMPATEHPRSGLPAGSLK